VNSQGGFELRFEWGHAGAARLAPLSDVLIVVDVLSFSTAVDVAVSRGASVVPVGQDDERTHVLAAQPGVILAVDRHRMSPATPYSLSPASLLELPPGSRLVLPSPNGAAIASAAAGTGSLVLTGCLRNASVIAEAAGQMGASIGVIAAGERRPDGTLRPAVEDLIGAGIILGQLDGRPSPEARAAVAASRGADPTEQLRDCISGRELIDAGHERDVQLAAEMNVSQSAPLLHDGAFIDARSEGRSGSEPGG